ncbi:MAG TPA: polynucleotide adenylyltransferase PcnB [Pseudomonas sabulinigri]|jgi:poly(A) polymerase|uniref:Poly A polymerase head domain-containing protein n=1 Tax=marine sediment metagenome TaxID=412755 RepID=A0A0F9WSR4_9ZZZZ|nr:polynucleotide adenylyltransferase PcnB [Halopseudomonas sabulinigri]HEC51406.1 polynucleotide adenylyltransferase PcnB [Halopseudomonas sabulinigri]|tara:strand:+ start:252 stop:1622 length:1371 start_codon:yes stop_codon:yes gene_type:complete
MIRKLLQKIPSPFGLPQRKRTTPTVIPASQHSLRRERLSRHAVTVVERLQQAGYQAFAVGGCVRDLLLNIEPKDFDIATSATPEQVRATFRNSRLIGRRFKLAHVHFGREIIEVATFRANHEEEANAEQSRQSESGRLLRDNVYGTFEQDAQRRDFTINALYYDVTSGQIHDFANGVHDIRNQQIRLIGQPEQRYQEDPVRMLRAIRFAGKLGFEIEPHTAAPIESLAPLLHDIPAARLFDEVLKLLMSGQGQNTFDLLYQYDLFAPLFPDTDEAIIDRPDYTLTLVRQALANTDERIAQGKPVTPAFLFAALLWPALPQRVLDLEAQGIPSIPAHQQAAQELLSEQCRHTAIPKRFSIPMREIWDLQPRLERRSGRRADQMLEHPRFRAAYDFLLLRESAGEQTDGLGDWWTRYQDANPDHRRSMIRDLGGDKSGPKKSRSRSRRKPRNNAPSDS